MKQLEFSYEESLKQKVKVWVDGVAITTSDSGLPEGACVWVTPDGKFHHIQMSFTPVEDNNED
jgi:hypothetical protein